MEKRHSSKFFSGKQDLVQYGHMVFGVPLAPGSETSRMEVVGVNWRKNLFTKKS